MNHKTNLGIKLKYIFQIVFIRIRRPTCLSRTIAVWQNLVLCGAVHAYGREREQQNHCFCCRFNAKMWKIDFFSVSRRLFFRDCCFLARRRSEKNKFNIFVWNDLERIILASRRRRRRRPLLLLRQKNEKRCAFAQHTHLHASFEKIRSWFSPEKPIITEL